MRQVNIVTLLLMLLFGLSLMSCSYYKGNGKVIVEQRNVGAFNRVEIDQGSGGMGLVWGDNHISGFHVKLIKDTAEYTTVEYDENLMHHIETESVNNKLLIHTKKALRSNRDIHVNVHYKNLERIDASASSEIIFSSPYHGKNLEVNLTGACDLKGKVFAEVLRMDVTGSADISIEGHVRKMKGDFSGAGTLNSFALTSDTCLLDITGAADANVNVQNYLKVDVSGVADIIYKGSPLIEKTITGAGEIKKSKDELKVEN